MSGEQAEGAVLDRLCSAGRKWEVWGGIGGHKEEAMSLSFQSALLNTSTTAKNLFMTSHSRVFARSFTRSLDA